MRKKALAAAVLIGLLFTNLSGCAARGETGYNTLSVEQVVAAAKQEGALNSLAMPDDWANWKDTWEDLDILYGIVHQDTDMSSVEELEQFQSGIGDIGDVGYEYGKKAAEEALTLAYKTSYWDEIPDWAKDEDGNWIICYTGTLAFLINEEQVDKIPTCWQDVMEGDYKVGISDVENASLGQYSVYAAAIAMGGGTTDIAPGISFFQTLAEQERLVYNIQSFDDYMDSGVGVMIKWDFQALSYRDKAAALESPVVLSACIPSDGSVTVGYASVINSLAENPYSAMLAREYILSDAGQINLAEGYATPIRSVKLPEDLEERRIEREQYTDSMIESGLDFTGELAGKIAGEWTKTVMPILAAQ